MSTIEGGGQFINNGLRLFYDAKNLNSYPMSGSTWFDILNPTLTATFPNGITVDTDGFFILNGINQYISLPKSVGLANSIPNYSFGIWFKPTNNILVGDTPLLMLIDAEDTSGGAARPDAYLYWDGSGSSSLKFRNFTGVGNDLSTTTNNWYAGVWYNVQCTYNITTGDKKIYVNGILENSSTGFTGAYYNTATFHNIGAYRNVQWFFPGSVSLFQLYTRTLTDSEVLKNFNLFKGRYNIL